uniref:Retrotransposon protein, putative, unclassified n=1 Tax=Oryza sativa subsp. japonica TaxID=39947 RepID=Q338S8_ORYSJ|nr:retrotransposon protein, putative, unclassified [Oryza sativa Japonica Group]
MAEKFSSKPHIYNGVDFDYWKKKMESYITSQGYDIWMKVATVYEIPGRIETVAQKTDFENNYENQDVTSSKHGKAKGTKGSTVDSGDKSGEPKDGEIEEIEEEEIEEQEALKFNNFQDQRPVVNPHVLTREQPRHAGKNVNRLTQEQIAAIFGPSQPVVEPIQSTPIRQQVVQPIRQQMVPQIPAGQRTPIIQQNQPVGAQFVPKQQIHNVQQPPQNYLGDVMKEQFGLKPKDTGNLYRHPYPEWFERVPLPRRYKVPDFLKFSRQDNVSTYEHVSRFLAQCGEASAVDALRGLITPIKEKFSSQDFESLSHLAQKVALHEQRFAEAKKNFKKVNHFYPYMYEYEEEYDSEWVKSLGKEEKYDFDITKADKIFDLLLREKQIQLPAGYIIPLAEELGELGKRKYCKWHNSGSHATNDCKVFRQQIQLAIEGGKIKFDDSKKPMKVLLERRDETAIDRRLPQNQKRSVQRMRNMERFQEVQQEINHRLKKTKQEWRIKSKVIATDEVEANKAEWLLKGKAVASSSVNMVFMLPVEYEAKQADVDVEETSTRLILSPEQAICEKPEGTENRHLKPLYVNRFVNGKPMSKMMVDGGAAINLMPYATFRKLGRNTNDLIKTNMILKDFGGNPSETKGVLNVELTCLIQWQGDKIEIMPADSQLKMESPNYYFEDVVEGSNFYTKDTVDDLDGKLGQGFMLADNLEEVDIGPGAIGQGRHLSQPPRRCKADMYDAIKAEITHLYYAGFIRPCRYAEWVSNIVPVIKLQSDFYGRRRYSQDCFQMSCAIGLYEWVVMTFGLKSAGATYQRAMNYIFHDLIGLLVEVYIDDILVKSKEVDDHIADLRKVFEITRKYGVKKNPTKCAFGVSARQFLGFLVHERGIEVTQRSVNAIQKIKPLEDKKQLQKLIDKKGVPFRLYLSAREKSIGSVFIQEIEGKERAIFYLSRRLLDAETSQLAGEYECKNDVLMVYNEKCRELMDSFWQGASGYKPMAKGIEVEVATIAVDDWSADQAKVVMGEVHEGYFWPTMLEDCFRYYKGCQDCQKFGAIQRAPASAMNHIIKPWSFRGWGMDMIGQINPPLSKGHKFILVATDYFTKWVEGIPLKKVDSGDAIRFVKEHIIYRFGIPQTITTDQGSIFVSDDFV